MSMAWFSALGNMVSMFPDTPALAVDMALNGADPDLMGYTMAYGLQKTPIPINVYPDATSPLPPLEA